MGSAMYEQQLAPEGRVPAVVLGMGNLLRRDEGLGIHALRRLQERYTLPADVRAVDGGTLGLDLLCYLEEADRVLVLDAALTSGPAGTLLRVAGDAIPAYFGMRTSPHEIALPDLLAITQLRGKTPPELVVLGLQPDTIELGWGLSTAVGAALDALVAAAVGELCAWGFEVRPRTQPLALAAATTSGTAAQRERQGVTCSLRLKPRASQATHGPTAHVHA